jgi:hypothetical protein
MPRKGRETVLESGSKWKRNVIYLFTATTPVNSTLRARPETQHKTSPPQNQCGEWYLRQESNTEYNEETITWNGFSVEISWSTL